MATYISQNDSAVTTKSNDRFLLLMMLSGIGDLLDKKSFGRVLDFDFCFAESGFRSGDNFKVEFDGLAKDFRGKIYPVHENLYRKIYRTFDECKYRHFDAILFTAERSPNEFIDVMIETTDLAENIGVLVRKNSPLGNWLNSSEKIFAAVEKFSANDTAFYLLKKRIPPVDVCVYVITHKDAQLTKLPNGYKFIHAGHVLAKNDLGYLGDDTGDNISQLNLFLNEVTALYWIWKNTSHTHTGFVHYRRFLTAKKQPGRGNTRHLFSNKNILSQQEILKMLNEYDIIVSMKFPHKRTHRELMFTSTQSPKLVDIAEKIVRKHLECTHPDYLDAFDDVINGYIFFPYNIHITRRNVFNAWCEWLFSFTLDAMEEILQVINFDNLSNSQQRIMGFFAEIMLTVWLMKNHLRIKTLPIMFRENI